MCFLLSFFLNNLKYDHIGIEEFMLMQAMLTFGSILSLSEPYVQSMLGSFWAILCPSCGRVYVGPMLDPGISRASHHPWTLRSGTSCTAVFLAKKTAASAATW